MQTCEVCGWDTRSDTRVCRTCRKARRDAPASRSDTDDAQLLSTVLRMARDKRHPVPGSQPHADGRHTVTPRSHAPPPRGEPDGERGEQIVLREIEPSDQPATVANGSATPALSPRPSVAASLLKALTGDPAAATPPADTDPRERPGDPETLEVADAPGDTTTAEPPGDVTPGDADTADELTAEAPGDTDATPPESDTDTDDRSGDADTADAAVDEPAATGAGAAVEREPIGSRVRTSFREIGGWTAAAQIGLLIVSLLCVFQVVVLLVVLRFLGEPDVSETVETADLLLAHRRATTIMLPALVIGALAAAALAIWRVRRSTDDAAPAAALLGVPASLWAMVAAAGVVAAIAATSGASTPDQAQRVTLLAVAACALLGATAFIAPRGLAAATDGDRSPPPNDDGADTEPDGG